MINVSEEMKHLHKLAIQAPSKRFNKLWHMLATTNPGGRCYTPPGPTFRLI
jgi:hypothetical protein